MENSVNSTKKLLDLLKVKFTSLYIEDSLLNHPEYPSLLSISDTLERYKIDNFAINIDQNDLNKIPLPSIVQVRRGRDEFFYVLKEITEKTVKFFDDYNILQKVSKAEFINIWTGICLLAKKTKDSKEKGIEKKLIEKKILSTLILSTLGLLIIWGVINYSITSEIGNLSFRYIIIPYLILKSLGLILCGLLLTYELDKSNLPLLNFCSKGSKFNCEVVLNFKFFKNFNDFISPALLGFSYFFSTLSYLLVSIFYINKLALLSILSLFSIPVVIISIYYQVFVIKKWCKLCLSLQGILLIEVVIFYINKFYKIPILLEDLPFILAMFLIPIITWKQIKYWVKKSKLSDKYRRSLYKMRNNMTVFLALLHNSKKIITPPLNMGITMGDKNDKPNIIKICNPYCDPCAAAHPILDNLYNQNKINLQILFFINSNHNSLEFSVVKYLLDIQNQGKYNIQEVLDEWYLMKKKDIKSLKKQYPVNITSQNQNDQIKLMNSWCKEENIKYTPTIFINGYELPEDYEIRDLEKLLD